MDVELLRQCWFLAGPTAVGKTELSFALADHLNAEILSLDSMAIYRKMDIGTAKPDANERARIPHHLIDLVEPHQEFSVADYVDAAADAVNDILSRNATPLFVGGTGLYLKALLRGMFAGPPSDSELRQQLAADLEVRGVTWLHEQLAKVDAASAARLHPNDTRRVIRAIEVFRVTGKPLSEQQQQPARAKCDWPKAFWLEPDRAWLHERIHRRVDHMMEAGFLEEVRALREMTPSISPTARQALGYRELLAHLNGECDLPTAVEQMKIGTRQFSKRQQTWFRNLDECQAVEVLPNASTETLKARLVQTT